MSEDGGQRGHREIILNRLCWFNTYIISCWSSIYHKVLFNKMLFNFTLLFFSHKCWRWCDVGLEGLHVFSLMFNSVVCVDPQGASWFTFLRTCAWTSCWTEACRARGRPGAQPVGSELPWVRRVWSPKRVVRWSGLLAWRPRRPQRPLRPAGTQCPSGSLAPQPHSPTERARSWPRPPSSAPPRSPCWTREDISNRPATPTQSPTRWYNSRGTWGGTGTHSYTGLNTQVQ